MNRFHNSSLVICCTGLLLLYAQGCKLPGKNTSTPSDRAKFGDNVRTTSFRTPEEERLGFHLPEGFEITLFAAEPDITK
ncbi:hypothetical protein ACFQ4C_21725, partial [Larkinella insperata]